MDRKTKFRLAAAVAWSVSLALVMLAISIANPIGWVLVAPMVFLIGGMGLLILLSALAATRTATGWIGVGGILVFGVLFLLNFSRFVSLANEIVFQRSFA